MRKCKLGNIANLTVGYVGNMKAEYITEGIPFFRSLNIDRFNINDNDLMYISDEFNAQLKKSELHEGDVVVVRTGIPGTCAVVPSKYDGSNCSDLVIIRPHKGINPHFIATFINFWGQKQISNNKVGAVQQHFNVGTAKEMIIFLPYDQDSIADYLVALNEKINMNNKSIKTLESMAKTLYDYWFVQFDFPDANGRPYKASGGEMVWNEDLGREIPEGWKSGIVSDLGDIVAGGTPSTQKAEYFSTDGVAWITPKDMSLLEGKYVFHGAMDISEDGLKNSSAKLMPAGSVLYTTRAPIGYVAVAGNSVCTNQGFKSVIPKENVGTEFVYYTLKSLEVHFKNVGNGSTFSEVSKEIFSSVPVCIPNNILLKKFNAIVAGYSMKQKNVQLENEQIISLRDFLLPMLMNGQVIFKS